LVSIIWWALYSFSSSSKTPFFTLIGHVFKAKPFQRPLFCFYFLHFINNWSKTSFKSYLLMHLCSCVIVDSLLGQTMILDLVYKSTPWLCIICRGLISFAHKKKTLNVPPMNLNDVSTLVILFLLRCKSKPSLQYYCLIKLSSINWSTYIQQKE
jgi:hypothetical protein